MMIRDCSGLRVNSKSLSESSLYEREDKKTGSDSIFKLRYKEYYSKNLYYGVRKIRTKTKDKH